MKKKITIYEHQRVALENTEVEIPEETKFYFFQRSAFAVIPEWTTWLKERGKAEEIWKWKVIEIDTLLDRIMTFSIQLSDIESILSRPSNSITYPIVNQILFYPNAEVRTKEQFIDDYKGMIAKIDIKSL